MDSLFIIIIIIITLFAVTFVYSQKYSTINKKEPIGTYVRLY